jgi:hypothetical protein
VVSLKTDFGNYPMTKLTLNKPHACQYSLV